VLELVLCQLRTQVAAACLERLGPSASRFVDRMLAASVRAAGHRERVLPAGEMSPQLGRGDFELRTQAVGHGRIEARLRRVLGYARAKISHPRTDFAVLRVVAEAAAMAHGKGVLPGREERVELRAQGFQVG
jgi:hypothetical protein